MGQYGKNAKMEKADLSLNTYLQYVEDFKLWVLAAGNAHRIPEKKIAKFLLVVSSRIFFVRRFIQDRVKFSGYHG